MENQAQDKVIPNESGDTFVASTVGAGADEGRTRASNVDNFLDMDIDDLIPDDYKNLESKDSGDGQAQQQTTHSQDHTQEPVDFWSDYNANTQTPPPAQETEQTQQEEPKEEDTEDQEDIELSDIEKFLETKDADSTLFADKSQQGKEGESSKTEGGGIAPWKSDERYTNLLASHGIQDPSTLDALITDAIDSKVITTSKYTQDLEAKLEQFEKDSSFNSKEIERLKELEKNVLFEHLEETKKEFTEPMTEAITDMKAITDIEGINLQSLISAKTKAEFTNALIDSDIQTDDLQRLTNHWRSYKEVANRYLDAKAEAMNNPEKLIRNSSVDDDTAVEILRDSLFNLIDHDKYAYIKDSIAKGYDGDEEVTNIIAEAKNEFFGLVKAFNDPLTNARNPKWLSSMAEYVIDAAHARNMENRYYSTKEALDTREDQLKKLATEYKRLASSARGDFTPGTRVPRNNGNQASKKDDAFSGYQKFLDGNLDIDDILK